MATQLIHDDRIDKLNNIECQEGDFVLYWMQQSQRAQTNHALEFAVRRANDQQLPLVVCFGLSDNYPDANQRHYQFMLEGLQETQSALQRRGIPLVVRRGDPEKVAIELARRGAEVICDRGYLRHQRQWRETVAAHAPCRVWQVEADVIVPVQAASDKAEYAARTIRSKLNDQVDVYCEELSTTPVDCHISSAPEGLDLSDLQHVLDELKIAKDVKGCSEFQGGTSRAKSRLKEFLTLAINRYDQRDSVTDPHVSMLSPYLHFGQISPVEVVNAVKAKRGVRHDAKDAYLEELIVRRELAVNFVYFQEDYDSLNCLPDWARETLETHEADPREHHYTASQLEAGETHDAAWNAAMAEMRHRGFLHNRMRMYWGKKIIEWTNTVSHAYRTALELNNKYFLDGRDPNSFANIGWLFGLHDRPHQERAIFGKVRYMSSDGLDRKIDVDAYVAAIEHRFGVDLTPEE